MPESHPRKKTLMDCADSFPGLPAVVEDYTDALKKDAVFLRESTEQLPTKQ